jgi:hypothetical protein
MGSVPTCRDSGPLSSSTFGSWLSSPFASRLNITGASNGRVKIRHSLRGPAETRAETSLFCLSSVHPRKRPDDVQHMEMLCPLRVIGVVTVGREEQERASTLATVARSRRRADATHQARQFILAHSKLHQPRRVELGEGSDAIARSVARRVSKEESH